MRVIYLNTLDSGGGAARAAVRLLHGVREAGVNTKMMVQRKLSDDCAVVGPNGQFGNELAVVPGQFWITLHLVCIRKETAPAFHLLFCRRNCSVKSIRMKPDIIHLHWLGEGFLRLESLARFERPFVWTLHDSWAFTGGCHIPFDCLNYREKCGFCPTLGSSRQRDLSRWGWRRKERIFRKLNLTVVSPSRWLASCAKSSSLLHGFPIEVIPNGLDLGRFRPLDKLLARHIIGLPQDKKLVLFGAMSCTSDKNKGFHLLQPAIQKLAAKGWKKRMSSSLFLVQPNQPTLQILVLKHIILVVCTMILLLRCSTRQPIFL